MWYRKKHTFNNPCEHLYLFIFFRTLKYVLWLEFGLGFTGKKEKQTEEDKSTCGSK